MRRFNPRPLLIIPFVVFVLLIMLIVPNFFGYIFHGVSSNEIGVQFHRNEIIGVKGPGIWHDMRFFADMINVKTEGLDFCVVDPEVLIKGAEQRIGVRACGRIRRPGIEHDYSKFWAQYRSLYTNDKALVVTENEVIINGEVYRNITTSGVVFDIASQAMKVCVGDRDFEGAVVGTARNDLRVCIDDTMSELAQSYGGLIIENVTVPNVALLKAAQDKMDEITDAKLGADLARKEADRASAEGERQLAIVQADIKVQQGKRQEEQRQKAITADLERQALEAQTAVIEAEKANELEAAELDLAIQRARRLAALEQAQADLADLSTRASIYTNNPRFAALEVALKYAEAYQGGEKMIVPGGANVQVLLGGTAVTPFLDVSAVPE